MSAQFVHIHKSVLKSNKQFFLMVIPMIVFYFVMGAFVLYKNINYKPKLADTAEPSVLGEGYMLDNENALYQNK